MNLYGPCFVLLVISLAGTCSDINVDASAIPEADDAFEESVTKETILRNETSLAEGKSTLVILEKFVDDLLAYDDASSLDDKAEEGRTFGVKRLQFMLMPMMYKMGVMMTLLVVLTVISLKTLAIGVLLVVLKLSALFGKLYTYGQGSNQGWSSQPQPVHVHVHNNGGGGNHHHSLHNGWDTASGYAEDEHYYYKG